ncbi:MAG: LysR family transcriptional regulator [Methyloligellaceae bacterium]
MRHIDLSLLRAFVMVLQSGGMTSAGKQLHLTQAAVSQQIKRLEEQFGVELFERANRRLTLTTHGERLLGYAQKILTLNDEIWSLMTTPEYEGEVFLGVPYDIVQPFMPPILKSFHLAWPKIHIRMVCSSTVQLKEKQKAGELDITLATEAESPDLESRLMADQLVWVGAKAGKAYLRNPLPVSLGDESCAFRSATVKALNDAQKNWTFSCSARDMAAQCATIEADVAVAPMLAHTVPDYLSVLGADSGLPPLPVYFYNIYTKPTTEKTMVTEVAEHIRKHFTSVMIQKAAE